jgi:hypothetical protein
MLIFSIILRSKANIWSKYKGVKWEVRGVKYDHQIRVYDAD